MSHLQSDTVIHPIWLTPKLNRTVRTCITIDMTDIDLLKPSSISGGGEPVDVDLDQGIG
jgi:hypothetical protein